MKFNWIASDYNEQAIELSFDTLSLGRLMTKLSPSFAHLHEIQLRASTIASPLPLKPGRVMKWISNQYFKCNKTRLSRGRD
jgi:hypothetical protein